MTLEYLLVYTLALFHENHILSVRKSPKRTTNSHHGCRYTHGRRRGIHPMVGTNTAQTDILSLASIPIDKINTNDEVN